MTGSSSSLNNIVLACFFLDANPRIGWWIASSSRQAAHRSAAEQEAEREHFVCGAALLKLVLKLVLYQSYLYLPSPLIPREYLLHTWLI